MFVIHNYNPNFLSYKKLLGIDLAVLPRPACRKAKIGEQRDAGTARFFMCAGSFRLLLRKIHLPPRGRLTMLGALTVWQIGILQLVLQEKNVIFQKNLSANYRHSF